MGALRIEKKLSDRDDLPPSSPPVSGVAVPPPPAEVVAVLQEYETKTRDSFPSFTELAPASATIDSSRDHEARIRGARNRPPVPGARGSHIEIAAVAIATAIMIVALLALLVR